MNTQERDRLILEHLEMVKIIALKIITRLPPGVDLDDLIHTGVLGLIEAAERFDARKGTKFATFASVRVRGAILDQLRHLDWASRNLRQKIKDLEQAHAQMELELGRMPLAEEVARAMGLNLEDYYRVLDESLGVGVGVFRYEGEDQQEPGEDALLEYRDPVDDQTPVLSLEKKEMKELLARLIDQLSERERVVLGLYYTEDLNLKEIGGVLGVTESRVSQIRSGALVKLRRLLREEAQRNRVEGGQVL